MTADAPRAWQVLQVALPLTERDRIAAILENMGTIGLEERLPGGIPFPVRQPWDDAPPPPPPIRIELLAYFPIDGQEKRRVSVLNARLAGLADITWTEGRLREGDWPELWREHFRPIHLGPELCVAPPWNAPAGAVIIEPGMAFGTGDHPTTLACMRAIVAHGRPGQRLLDVGCGSGILALLGAKMGMIAYGVDIDPDAVRVARENAACNRLPGVFDATPISRISGPYDLVVANVFAEELARMAMDLVRVTGARLVVAGILADRAHLVKAALSELILDRETIEGEWVCMEWVRR